MITLARRDPLGARTLLFDPESGAHASDLATLLERFPRAREAGLDPLGIDAAWGLADASDADADAEACANAHAKALAPDRTCLRAFRAVPPGAALVLRDGRTRIERSVAPGRAPSTAAARAPTAPTALASSLLLATSRVLTASRARHPVVALGGGIDAVLAVLAARRSGFAIDHAIHLSVPGTRYDESDAARATAATLGLSLHEIRVTVSDLAASLPRAVRLAGTPFYNLHPVSRAIVARVARDRGHDVLVTGDGADQAARGALERADYVPLVTSITRGSGITPASPFVDDDLVDGLVDLRDPAKAQLREVARTWGLDDSIAARPKVPSWAPPLPRSAFPDAAELAKLRRLLGSSSPLSWTGDDRSNVRIASLASFVRGYEIELPARGAA